MSQHGLVLGSFLDASHILSDPLLGFWSHQEMDVRYRLEFFERHAFIILVKYLRVLVHPFHDFAEHWMDGCLGKFLSEHVFVAGRPPSADEEQR